MPEQASACSPAPTINASPDLHAYGLEAPSSTSPPGAFDLLIVDLGIPANLATS
ncbi:MAG: hypothetical protein HOL51_28555 [Gemmatimonadetes bacterium]|nr:hypothetical protein [Gemmatimonadota bacterium]MBT5330074.1 hypothetical protein [Gemmatimonadota bacterium]MBT5449610.1 hypothetical protein [Gemmatimonadota bacterium]MBT5801852.1 hypothetical protein [Gemmatimonadota bacterium]MBT6621114.1 hypothetical protein [Gemmatimonadota bacterium]